ncbi:hypothetical protein BJI69_19515 [Luteibacter rhizovicinus DSM 16549]|uniref:Uncharacterized protein n=2 Tax=Luteibacter rhizovicinus TaxID=242606 RepID=A0A0G9HCH9_9GAMM|nr:hypothetical protein BJI69_19515 [Luteibacter rhizovicinus DSM 16549]KLD67176.1 hypothetical protein Y883_09485 [Luteibacter rhizovicinus DSM 16549]KLD75844.1 hypothetical protein Y886_24660 [Xanthomonas hyacinthi DSM 19077]
MGMGRGALCVCFLGGFVLSGAVHAAEQELCATLSEQSSIVRNERGHILRMTIHNPTKKTIETEEYYFWSNGLSLGAVSKADGRKLKATIPFIDPGVGPLLIRPNETVTREVLLEDVISDLGTALRSSDVDVSWALTLRPNKGCFSEQVKSTVTLEKFP